MNNVDNGIINPLVTIITPTYNQGQFIEATIKSVLGQSYKNIEYIIINALSTDNTNDILELYRKDITKIISERDEGQSDAIVKGFKMAKGELVGWINSDDLLYPDCVEKIVTAYQNNPEAVLFYNSKMDILSEDGSFRRLMDVPTVDKDQLLRRCNTLVQPGSFYKKEALVKVDYFDKNLRFSMDLDLWLRLLNIGAGVNIASNPIAGYREWEGTKTSTGANKLLQERKKLLISHGVNMTDKTMTIINIEIFKHLVKDTPYLGSVCKAIVSFLKRHFFNDTLSL